MRPNIVLSRIVEGTKTGRLTGVTTVVALGLALLAGGVAIAQTADGFDLSWSTTGAGNTATARGGSYSLLGNVGHTAAGELTSEGYTLTEGFLSVILTTPPKVNPIPAITWWGLWLLASLVALALTGRTLFSRRRRRPAGYSV
ncbi:MAG: hypothetical protein O3A47_01375 [Chloroflexi bacterium]|nr:hypothetical protein [Chloroflexota bacterium]